MEVCVLRVMLVDDEPLILVHLENLLKKIDDIEIVGTFLNPNELYDTLEHETTDIVFLDIEMPETNGLELAERIQSRWSHIKIVFVTAHSEYAVKAFDLNAVDYLLKPVQTERLQKTIHRLREEVKETSSQLKQLQQVCCFRSLQFKGTETMNVRWRTAKAKELFAYLLQHHGKPISKGVLLDLFWPDTDWEKGFAHLYTTIYQIRRLLRENKFNIKISSLDNSYVLDLNGVKFDIKEWEQKVVALPAVISKSTFSEYINTLDLYQGGYLEEEGYLWAESERERLRTQWLSLAQKVIDYLDLDDQITEALVIAHRMHDYYPYIEEHYFMLMKLYDRLGDPESVEVQYQNLVHMIATEYGKKPSSIIQDWYKQRKNVD